MAKKRNEIPSARDLVSSLWSQAQKLEKGELQAAEANAYCNQVGKILATVRLQLAFCKAAGVKPKIDTLRLEYSESKP